jgi:hypothetical protein
VALIDHVLAAYGGIDRWRRLQRFTAHISINGRLLAWQGREGKLKDVVAEGSLHEPSVRLTGFTAPDKCGVYRPDRVAIERVDGTFLAARDNPRGAFPDHSDRASWDDLHLACFCGIYIWNCIAAPFLLATQAVEIDELGPWHERTETWWRFRAVFPASAGTFAQEQLFYFDQSGLQRRTDYAAIDDAGVRVAHYSWAHQPFSDIVVATLHRCLVLQPDETPVRKPSCVDIEIFDAAFE